MFEPANSGWSLGMLAGQISNECGIAATVEQDITGLVQRIVTAAQPGDSILVMSNGGFGGIHDKLLEALAGG